MEKHEFMTELATLIPPGHFLFKHQLLDLYKVDGNHFEDYIIKNWLKIGRRIRKQILLALQRTNE